MRRVAIFLASITLASLLASSLGPAEPDLIVSLYSPHEFELTADPKAPHWRDVPPVIADHDALGNPVPGHRTEIRSRWTDQYLYFLFVCPYEELYLKPDPVTDKETPKLWEWDVAEVFIGADFENIKHYREFQVSPQGEFIDLDIHSDRLNAANDMLWNSGFQVMARIDRERRVWYGEMKIPIRSIDARPPREGNQMRVNFYRLQGPPPNRRQIAWRPTGSRSHHVPEAFGRLILKR